MGDELDPLRRRHPGWSIWFGRATGSYWAAPLWTGAPMILCEGVSLSELEECMTFYDRVS